MADSVSMAITTWLLMKGTVIRSTAAPTWLLLNDIGAHEKNEITVEGIMIKIGVAAVITGYTYYCIWKLKKFNKPKPKKHYLKR